ncbi:hypothetical protein SASPL_114044 [Salvia splendens]|uniref:BED-type domain-containing protein n=1 Tax=Salvia splendens TaxID=180675 RepID=A0A8X9A015_SALSN|nr:hypothetical protein SASPL_114044 [Salvia splendens]
MKYLRILKMKKKQEQKLQVHREKEKRGKVPSKRKSTSVHWNNYDKMMVEEGNPPVARTKAKCKECGTLIVADAWNGTNGLKNHTISCLKKKADAEVGSGQTILAYSVDGQSRALTTWKFDQKKFRLGLCKMILLDELPFLFVEREGFLSFMRLVCPQFQIPSRQTIRTDCVQLFLEEKQSLVKLFQKRGMGRVSITTDCWTSVNNNSFICVTAHYIGKDWVLHKKIISFSQIDSHKGADIGPPEEEDWVNVKKMVSYLKKFHSSTQIVSVTKKPTSHLFFAEMCGIFDLIRRLEMNNDKEVSSMASKMKLNIGKYWLEETELNVKMNKILYIAAILDPRKKMKHVETCFKLLYGNARGLEMVKEVTDSMRELFVFYSARYAPRPPSRSSVDATIEDTSDEEDSYNMFGMDISDDDGDSSNQTELDIYLTDRRHKVPKEEMTSFDLLKWWSEHSHYHVLSEMARDILAIPVSSVASESAFSMGGRVLSPYRSSLTCTMVEALICAGDWLKTSDLDKKEEEDVDEEEQEKEYHGAMAPTSARLTLMPNEG